MEQAQAIGSPKQKAHKRAYSIAMSPSSVRQHFQTASPLHLQSRSLPTFINNIHRQRNQQKSFSFTFWFPISSELRLVKNLKCPLTYVSYRINSPLLLFVTQSKNGIYAVKMYIWQQWHQVGNCTGFLIKSNTVELQWLEHWWLVYHGCFELVPESLGKKTLAADLG